MDKNEVRQQIKDALSELITLRWMKGINHDGVIPEDIDNAIDRILAITECRVDEKRLAECLKNYYEFVEDVTEENIAKYLVERKGEWLSNTYNPMEECHGA